MIRKQRNMNVGAALIFVLFGLLFFVLLFRFVSIQVSGEVSGQPLVAKAQQKYFRSNVLEAKRGGIYDRNGEVIAEDTTSYTLIAILDEKMTVNKKNPNHVVDKKKTAHELAKYIDMEEDEIYRILSKEGLFQVEFGSAGKDLSFDTKQKIEALNLPGIKFRRELKRFYPNGIFAPHVIGFSEKDAEGKQTGRLGIEKQLNDLLTGKNGKWDYQSDRWGYLLAGGKENSKPAQHGMDVYLTIDKKIQTFVEDALNQVAEQYNPKKAIAIVVDPHTGKILGMGQRPTFEPATRKGIDKTWHNEAVEISFEPGSTMKVFTLAAALEENAVNLNDTFESGTYKVTENSRAIRDHNRKGWGTISYLEGLQRSSNVAFAKIVAEKLGFETYREYLTKFGFGKPTGIELPNEASGKIVYNYPLEKITTAYGQGTAITPIQQIQAMTAIAGDGTMLKPQIIEKIVDPNTGKTIKKTEPEVVGNPISEETARKVREALKTVVSSPKGTGYGKYNIEGYEVAGKTGTANFTENGVYLHGGNNYIFSFLGMAPADDPELIVYVAVQQPETENNVGGSNSVSLAFKLIMQNSLQYLNIKPSGQEVKKPYELPDLTGKTLGDAVREAEKAGSEAIVLGNGKTVIKQMPEHGPVLAGEKVILITDGVRRLPDLTGWSLRDVMKIAALEKLELKTTGKGYVTNQNLKPGTIIKEGDILQVDLKTYGERTTDGHEDKQKEEDIANDSEGG